jgi:hypothetical protein
MTDLNPEADIADEEELTLVPEGWDGEDVSWLKDLAAVGMNIARAMNRKVLAQQVAIDAAEAAGETPVHPDLSKIALDYTRVSRAIRMTLALKAWANGGEGPGPSFRGFEPGGDPDDDGLDDPDDPENFVVGYAIPEEEAADWNKVKHEARLKAEIRLAMSHLIEGHEPPEREQLWDKLELRLEQETGGRNLHVSNTQAIIESVCKDFGVACEWRAGLNREGQYKAWIIARPGDPTGPRYFEDLDPMAKCLKGRPDPPLRSKVAVKEDASSEARRAKEEPG